MKYNPFMDWEEISGDRIQQKNAGFFVIKPKDDKGGIPFFCPNCGNQMKNAQDAHYYRTFQACYKCSTLYAEPNKEAWLKGWRPQKST